MVPAMRSTTWRSELSRSGLPISPRKYFWARMLVAFCDQDFGTSTSGCSKATDPSRWSVSRASRRSHTMVPPSWLPPSAGPLPPTPLPAELSRPLPPAVNRRVTMDSSLAPRSPMTPGSSPATTGSSPAPATGSSLELPDGLWPGPRSPDAGLSGAGRPATEAKSAVSEGAARSGGCMRGRAFPLSLARDSGPPRTTHTHSTPHWGFKIRDRHHHPTVLRHGDGQDTAVAM